MLPTAWIYILTNKHNTTLYVGVTTDLSTRLWEHRRRQNPKSFVCRYNLLKLVYYEGFASIVEAINVEKYLKGKKRSWKNAMITDGNPGWKDLSNEITVDCIPSTKTC